MEAAMSITLRISATGSSALRMLPLRAMPLSPASARAGMSSAVTPPMPTTGRARPSRRIPSKAPVAFESQGRGQPGGVLGSGEAERAAADVVRPGSSVHTDVLQSIGGTSYYILSPG